MLIPQYCFFPPSGRWRCENPWLALVYILFWFDILPLVDKDFTCTSDYSDIFVLQGTGEPVTIFAFDVKSSSESQVSTEKVGTLVCNVWTYCVGMSVISILQWIHLETIYSELSWMNTIWIWDKHNVYFPSELIMLNIMYIHFTGAGG